MLHSAKLPKIYWSFVYLKAAYIHNRLPNSRIDTSPLEVLYGLRLSPNALYPFGAKAIVHAPSASCDKLDEQGQECFLLGYPKAGAGWLFWSSKMRHMIHSTSAVFPDFQALEIRKDVKKGDVDFLVNQIKLVLGKEPTEELAANEIAAIASLPQDSEHNLPCNIKLVLKTTDATEWRLAAEYEVNKFRTLDVWQPTNPHKGMKVLGARWVFTIKRKPNGSIDKYRARYVAKGFNQTPGLDCNETYATASLNTLWLLLSISQ